MPRNWWQASNGNAGSIGAVEKPPNGRYSARAAFCLKPDQGMFMSVELNYTGAQHDLKQMMGLKEKKRSKRIVDWVVGEHQGRRALAEQLLLADRPGSAKLLVASTRAPRTRLSRRLQVLAAIMRLGLRFDTEEFFDLLDGCRRFGDEFREQAVLVIRKKQDDDEVAKRSAAVPERTKVPITLPAAPVGVLVDHWPDKKPSPAAVTT
jgi:hypothetical protein